MGADTEGQLSRAVAAIGRIVHSTDDYSAPWTLSDVYAEKMKVSDPLLRDIIFLYACLPAVKERLSISDLLGSQFWDALFEARETIETGLELIGNTSADVLRETTQRTASAIGEILAWDILANSSGQDNEAYCIYESLNDHGYEFSYKEPYLNAGRTMC